MSGTIEVLGNSFSAILGASDNKLMVDRTLAGMGLPVAHLVKPDEWYPRDRILAVFNSIFTSTGPATVRAIGGQIPAKAAFPPNIQTVADALRSLNVAYHMNHRIDGRVMFDPATGKMLEGIGHYTYTADPADHNAHQLSCQNPYPCQFDIGLLEALADRFRSPLTPFVTVRHARPGCRAKGGLACVYRVKLGA